MRRRVCWAYIARGFATEIAVTLPDAEAAYTNPYRASQALASLSIRSIVSVKSPRSTSATMPARSKPRSRPRRASLASRLPPNSHHHRGLRSRPHCRSQDAISEYAERCFVMAVRVLRRQHVERFCTGYVRLSALHKLGPYSGYSASEAHLSDTVLG